MSEQEHFVFVVEYGCYSDRMASAVYATLEAALKADNDRHPGKEPKWEHWSNEEEDGGYAEWRNSYNWEESCSITRFKVQS
jgi:hypothetical protein